MRMQKTSLGLFVLCIMVTLSADMVDTITLKKRFETDKPGLIKELTIEGEISTPSGHIEVRNGKKIFFIKAPWGIQWHFDASEFLPNIAYRMCIEYSISVEFKNKIPKIAFSLYDIGNQSSCDCYGKSVRTKISTKGLKTNKWLVMKSPAFEPSRHNGYMYLTYFPEKYPGLPADKMVQVKRIWAEPAFDKIINQNKLISSYLAYKQKKQKTQKYLADYHRNLKHYPQEKWFLTGAYFGPGGVEYSCKYYQVEPVLYWDVIMRGMKQNGLDTAMIDMIRCNPKMLEQYLNIAEKYNMKVFAGTMGKPLSSRYAPKKKIDNLDWEKVSSNINKITQAVKGYPNLVGYYLCDESKEYMLIPLLKAMKIFEKYDSQHPALPMTWGSVKYMPIVNTRAGYAFYTYKKSQFNALANVRDYTDECRKKSSRPLWMILHSFSSIKEKAKMPTPQEMETQTYLAFTGKTTGLFYYYFYMKPIWCFSNGLVDSFMNPNKTCLALKRILGHIRGVGELCAEQGNFLENNNDELNLSCETFKRYYSSSKLTDVRPQVRYGVWLLPEGRGKILVMVNQDLNKTAKVNVKTIQPLKWYNLKTLKKLEVEGNNIFFSFEPGQGKMVWLGPASKWNYVSNYVKSKRLKYNSEILKIDWEVAQKNGLKLPDMSFLKSKEICMDAFKLKKAYEKALAIYNETVRKNSNFHKTLLILNGLQKKLGQISRGCPYKTRKWNDTTPFSSLKQLFLRAGGIYLKTRYNFNNKGLTLSEAQKAELEINALIQQISVMPDFQKEISPQDEKLSNDAAFN